MGKPNQYGRNFGYKYSHFGSDTNGHDLLAYGNTTGKYIFWDASADTFYINGTLSFDGTFNADNIVLADAETLTFGTGSDVVMQWDGTNMIIAAAADDSLIEIGDSDSTQKSFDLKWYGNESSGASYLYADASANLIYTTGVDLQFKDNDYIVMGSGSDATGDVTLVWNGTNLTLAATGAAESFNIGAASHVLNTTVTGTLTVGVDDTGYDVKLFGATTGKYFLWDESADSAIVSGILQLGTTATEALAFGGGTSASKLTTATADKNFGGMWTQSTATSGDSRGLYWKHYLGGTIAATGFGDAVRAFCSVSGTGYSYASGVHATMQVETGATVTGSGAGLRATLAAASATRTLVGQLAALQVDSDIGANNTVPTRCSLIRLAKTGTVDVPYFLDVSDDQCLKGSAASGSASDALAVILPNGTVRYINLYAPS